jgi:homocysteine S-methyltransferase
MHFADGLPAGEPWLARVRGLHANASTKSHAELDEATDLDSGDPTDLAARYVALAPALPRLSVLGGCCGTDHRHVEAIRDAWLAR